MTDEYVNIDNQQVYPDKANMEREKGIYKGPDEESFESESSIKRRKALEGDMPEISYGKGLKKDHDVFHIIKRSKERSEAMRELSPRSENYMEVEVPDTSIFNVIGDVHFGHPEVDHDRLEQELRVILNTPNSYVILLGDLVEGIHWGGAGGAEQSQTLDEQRIFLKELFKKLNGKVIWGTGGEHDSKWAAKTGSDPYFDFTERTGAPYIRGVAEVKLTVGEQVWRVVGQHRARGFSKYNKNHPTFSEARFELQNGQIYIAGHTHQKQLAEESIRKFGKAEKVQHINIGAYKKGGEHGDRQGYPKQMTEELFGASFVLTADKRRIFRYYDILEAHEDWA